MMTMSEILARTNTYIMLMYLISPCLVAWKNAATNSKIERMGYKINPDERSFLEIAISYIKEYGYLLIPGYNLYKSFKNLVYDSTSYTNKRINLLKESERLVEIKKEEKPVQTTNQETKNEERTPERNVQQTQTRLQNTQPTRQTTTQNQEMSAVEEMEYLKKMNRELRQRHARLVSLKQNAEANEVCHRINEITTRYKELERSLNTDTLTLRRK